MTKMPFEICGATVRPGTKENLRLTVSRRMDGQENFIPLIVINGRGEGPTLLLDGCVHGDEPEGALAILRLVKQIDPEKLRGVILAVPAVNAEALMQMRRGNPRDEHSYDLNRNYPGMEGRFLTEGLAHKHFTELLSRADLEISIHGGGNHSYMVPLAFKGGLNKAEGPETKELARALGPDWPIILHSLGNNSSEYEGKKQGSITVEIGGTSGAVPWLFDGNIRTLLRAFYNVLYHYDMLDGQAVYAPERYIGHQVALFASTAGLLDPVYESPIGKKIAKGTPLLRLVDLYGEIVQEAVAPCDCIPFGLRTYPSVDTGDWLGFLAEIETTETES